MSTLTRTGVFARPEQVERIRAAHMTMPKSERQQVVYACALACGLPEIEGYYSCDLVTGEFVRS